MASERNKSAEWHADQADDELRRLRGAMAQKPELETDNALRTSAALAQAHALTALALRKVGER